MNTIRDLLRGADPLMHEPPLSPVDVARMREAVLAAAIDAPAVRVPWVALAATTLAVIAGMFATHAQPAPARAEPLVASGPGVGSLRQLQFATPGGTRVIWMFNPELELR
jgi:hypothetical protein